MFCVLDFTSNVYCLIFNVKCLACWRTGGVKWQNDIWCPACVFMCVFYLWSFFGSDEEMPTMHVLHVHHGRCHTLTYRV